MSDYGEKGRGNERCGGGGRGYRGTGGPSYGNDGNYQGHYHGARQVNDVVNGMGQMRVDDRNGHGGPGGRGGPDRNRNGGGGGWNMYSQNPNSQGNRAYQPTIDHSAPARSAHNPNAPIAKNQLPYNTQEFAKRPPKMISEMKLGDKVYLVTNHALVMLPAEPIKLYCYNVEIYNGTKHIDKREEAVPIFWAIIQDHDRHFPHRGELIFNDVNQLWSCKKITTDAIQRYRGVSRNTRHFSMVLKFSNYFMFGVGPDATTDTSMMSTITHAIATARVRMATHEGTRYTVFKRLTFLVLSNAKERSMPDVPLYHPIKWGTDAKVGFSIAFRMNLRAGITACFDINHSVFTRPGYPLVRLFVELCAAEPITDEEYEENYDEYIRNARPDENNKRVMEKILHGMTLHFSVSPAISMEAAMGPNRAGERNGSRQFKFYELADSALEETFEWVDRDNVVHHTNIATYFRITHQYILRYPHLPCVMKKPSQNAEIKRILFPMELCSYIVNPTRYQGFFPESFHAEMIRFTTYTPKQRRILLEHVISQRPLAQTDPVVDSNDVQMRRHGVSIQEKMLEVKATVLPAPTIIYGNSTVHDKDHTGVWEAMRNEPVRTVLPDGILTPGGELKKKVIGAIIAIESPRTNSRELEFNHESYAHLMRGLAKSGQPIVWADEALRVPAILNLIHYNQSHDTPQDLFKSVHTMAAAANSEYTTEGDGFVIVPLFFLLFRERAAMYESEQTYNDYNLIKFLMDNKAGIVTQGMLVANFNCVMPDMTVCPFTCHVVEKILGKIGTTHRKLEREGAHKSWTTLTNPDAPTLVLGIDVSHPKTQDRENGKGGKPSKRWQAGKEHEPKDINSLSVATVVGNIDLDITQFRASNRLQDAGIEQIIRMEHEVSLRITEFVKHTGKMPAHIVVYRDGISEGDFQKFLYEERTAIESVCKQLDINPTLTYIVVSKRHHTKFFARDKDTNQFDANIKPGTLVEDVVTTTNYYDFFLGSQVGMIGTSRPTHYYVLHDTWAPMVSFWPTVTHALTYSFARVTSTTALPSPIEYAHLAAKRAKETLYAADIVRAVQNEPMYNPECLHDIGLLTEAINAHPNYVGMPFI
ncbi:unnamed protein product [Caenorhabditis sp. 36 PRJEB53466]|nr:unnamed protein product [Caenorhabditis sp. 36 PRJEB53466]